MKFRKITTGFVIQNYEDGKCVSQEFVAGDEVEYEDETGDPVDFPDYSEEYQPFDMVQPKPAVQ